MGHWSKICALLVASACFAHLANAQCDQPPAESNQVLEARLEFSRTK